jgi:protoporphyrinogen oxidase
MARIVIIGAGPCGLGAAYRLRELGHEDFVIYEKQSYVGGLAASFCDSGFFWDLGCHVIHSNYEYFDRVTDAVLGSDRVNHGRNVKIKHKDAFIPFPFQNNIGVLRKDEIIKCINGLIDSQELGEPRNYDEWLIKEFGQGIADIFLTKYNQKTWSYPLDKMSYDWIGKRVAVVDLKELIARVIMGETDESWGTNSTFIYPSKGGIGSYWNKIASEIGEGKILHGHSLERIDLDAKIVTFDRDVSDSYDYIISSMPLSRLLEVSRIRHDGKFVCNSTLIQCLGFSSPMPEKFKDLHWTYHGGDSIFNRINFHSNYSRNNVPDPDGQWSLIAEISYFGENPYGKETLLNETLNGLMNEGIITSDDISQMAVERSFNLAESYPIPTLNRDKDLTVLLELEACGIFSRGRFGAMKYEVGNMDHSFMQGVEVANRILLGVNEKTINEQIKRKVPIGFHDIS